MALSLGRDNYGVLISSGGYGGRLLGIAAAVWSTRGRVLGGV